MCIVRRDQIAINRRITAIEGIRRPFYPIRRVPFEMDAERLQRILSTVGTSPRTHMFNTYNHEDYIRSIHSHQEGLGASPHIALVYPNTISERPVIRRPCSPQPKAVPKKGTGPVMFTARAILIISFTLVVAKLVSNLVVSADALYIDRPFAIDVSTERPSEAAVSTDRPAAAYTPTPKKPVKESQCTGKAKRQLPPLEQGNQLIDSIFQIPISTLNAVESLIMKARPFVRRTRERIQQYYFQQRPTKALQQLMQQQHVYNSKPNSEEEPNFGYSDQPPFIVFFTSEKNKDQKQRDDLQIEGRLHRHEYIDDY